MQLGARWRVRETPHPGVPRALYTDIAAAEAAHPTASSWTLTWLEGRARVELFGPTGPALAELRDGETHSASTDAPDDEDDWLS